MTVSLSGLTKRLIHDQLLSESLAVDAETQAKAESVPIVKYLVDNQLLDATSIALSASDEFGLALFDLNAFNTETMPVDLVSDKLIAQHRAVPLFKRGSRLFIGVSDPTNLNAIDEIKFHTGLTTESILVPENQLGLMLEKLLDKADNALDGLDDEALDALDIDTRQDGNAEPSASEEEANDAPVVRFINQMLLSAIKKNASDLHFEPYEKMYRVRFRIDGVLEQISRPPVSLGTKIAARLKVMSNLDISERRVPQDGRIKLKISANKSIDFRVNTLPTLYGEKIVLRILDSSSAKMGIDALGYEDAQKQLFLNALSKPQGMILVTGPTGSGKTVSLYTGLNILNKEGINISTAEDPVEINLTGINQVNVRPKIGLDFAAALRAFLRQDPDVIMVGEIRDLETATISIKAAQTGHLVLSTLHTNGAAETITRLMNMGVPAFNIATTVNLIIAQRLARRLCSHCKQPADIPKPALIQQGFTDEQFNTATIYQPIGCNQCNKGYKGRIGIYEVVPVTPAISKIIMSEGNAIQLNQQFAEEGYHDLRKSGLAKVAQGLTSLEEINRVTAE